MPSTTIRYKVVPTNLLSGVTPVNRFVVLHNGTIVGDTVYAIVSQKTGMPQPMVKATASMIVAEMASWLGKGYRLEFQDISAFLALPGSVASTSAESRREAPPKLVVRLVAKGDFKKCCQGPEFVLENVTPGATVVINSVVDTVLQTPNVLPNGANVEVHIPGNGLFIPDPADPTVGVYLADSDGADRVKANVLESTSTSIICVCPQIALEPGTYKLCVASRNGMDPELYGVTVGSRNVRVVDDDSEDEEESHNG